MSRQEVERFINDMKTDTALLDEVKSGAIGLSSVIEAAKAKGYNVTLDAAKAYIAEQAGAELNDEQLDQVAAGKGGQKTTAVGTSTSTSGVVVIVAC